MDLKSPSTLQPLPLAQSRLLPDPYIQVPTPFPSSTPISGQKSLDFWFLNLWVGTIYLKKVPKISHHEFIIASPFSPDGIWLFHLEGPFHYISASPLGQRLTSVTCSIESDLESLKAFCGFLLQLLFSKSFCLAFQTCRKMLECFINQSSLASLWYRDSQSFFQDNGVSLFSVQGPHRGIITFLMDLVFPYLRLSICHYQARLFWKNWGLSSQWASESHYVLVTTT